MNHRKFIVKIETPGLLISLKGKTVRTPVTIIATEDEIPLIKLQVKTNSAGCKIDELFENGIIPPKKEEKVEVKKEKKNLAVEEKIEEKSKKEEDFNFTSQIDIEELSIKYETLLDKMIKSTKWKRAVDEENSDISRKHGTNYIKRWW